MAIKSVRKYESTDGKLHDSIHAAKKHDAQSILLTQLRQFFQNQTTYSNVHLDVANNPTIATALKILAEGALDWHRKYGKLKKEKAPEVYATALPKPPTVNPIGTATLPSSYLPSSFPVISPKSKSIIVKRPVCQYDASGNIINTFESVAAAARTLHVSPKSISACARREIKSAYGYGWDYIYGKDIIE